MKSEHLVGTSIPRFTYDTPTVPGNDFYALCEGEHPLCMIFLPGAICCGLYDPTNHSTGARSSPADCRPPRHGSTMEVR